MKFAHKIPEYAAVLTALLVCACKPVEDVDILADNIVLSESSLELVAGESAVLSAVVRPASTTDKTLQWSSTKKTVATVDGAGLVRAVSQGHAYIVALNPASGVKASCLVAVKSMAPYNVFVSDEDGTPVEDEFFVCPGLAFRFLASTDDGRQHSFIWESDGDALVDGGIVTAGLAAFEPSEGYLHCQSQNVRVASEDGFFAQFKLVSNISSDFKYGNSLYRAGSVLSMGDARTETISLCWRDNSGSLTELPASLYELKSSDISVVGIAREGGIWKLTAAAGRSGQAVLSLRMGTAETELCSVKVAVRPDYGGSIEDFPYEEW